MVALAAALLGLGCAPSRGAAVAANVEKAEEERSPDKLLERGRAFAKVRDYTRAEQYLSAALDAGAPADKVLPSLLKVCVAENRFRAAIGYAEPHLSAHPEDYRLRFVVASLYASIGETETALDHLARAAKSKPDYAEVHFATGVLLRDTVRDPIRADRHFREYLRLDPDGSHAAEARGSLLRALPTPPGDARGHRGDEPRPAPQPPGGGAAPPQAPEGAAQPPAHPSPPPQPGAGEAAKPDAIWKTLP